MIIFFSFSSCRELNLVECCQILPSRRATKDEVMLLHSEEHYQILEKTSGVNDDENMEDLSSRFDSVYVHPVKLFLMYFFLNANVLFLFLKDHF